MIVRFATLATVFLAASLSLAADKEVEDLLAKMRAKYSSAKTAHIITRATSSSLGKSAVTVDVVFQQKAKIRAKVFGLPFMKGKTWNFISDGSKIASDDFTGHPQYSEFDPDHIPMPVNLEVMSFWDWERQLSTEKGANMEHSKFKLIANEAWDGKKWTVLEETAYGQSVFVRYFIDPKTYLIGRVIVYDIKRSVQRQEMVVKKIEINQKVNSRIFEVKGEPEEQRTVRGRVYKSIGG